MVTKKQADQVHHGDLLNGRVICSCGATFESNGLASDAVGEFYDHVEEMEAANG